MRGDGDAPDTRWQRPRDAEIMTFLVKRLEERACQNAASSRGCGVQDGPDGYPAVARPAARLAIADLRLAAWFLWMTPLLTALSS